MIRLIRGCGVVAAVLALGSPVTRTYAQNVAFEAGSEKEASIFSRRVTLTITNVSVRKAIQALASASQVRIQFRGDVVDAITTPVTVRASDKPLGVVLDDVLRGTGLRAESLSKDVVDIRLASGAAIASVAQGSISGRVVDGDTKQGLHGATVSISGIDRGTTTNDDGTFRFADVTPGAYTVHVRMLGYVKTSKPITVTDGQSASLTVALERSVNALDQIVVTGTIIPTELKAVPSAITVITAKDIEQRGITRIDQLFHGDVPGLFSQNSGSGALLDSVIMYSRGATALTGDAPLNTTPMKIYVDGVELAIPGYFSQLDPKSIERIEILAGPQASTIYGSNAINGVMQIFTKRGTMTHPQLSLTLMSGWIQNNFTNAATPQHDYSAQVNGVEGKISYNAGGSWNYIGPWTPAKQTTRTSGFGGARFDLPTTTGRWTADVSLRLGVTTNRQHGGILQVQNEYANSGWWKSDYSGLNALVQPAVQLLNSQTRGIALSYAPMAWWSHELGVGYDISNTENRETDYLLQSATLALRQGGTERRSLRYVMTTRIPLAAVLNATIVGGVDGWNSLTSSVLTQSPALTGTLSGPTTVSRVPSHNRGAFTQAQLDIGNQLFLTYGLRAEWNPDYGKDALPNYAPRYGVAYTRDFGPVTGKIRGSYGRSTRPPQAKLKLSQTIQEVYDAIFQGYWAAVAGSFIPYYGGIFGARLANPELGPEFQQGGEGGIELYLGGRGSIVVTRYNQTVDGLIVSVPVDSIKTLVPCPPSMCSYNSLDADGFGYYRQYQNGNVASIRNQGWELQATTVLGPFSTRGTYSWTKSRAIGITSKYRSWFSSPSWQPGATTTFLPEHTWALAMTWAHAASMVQLNVTGTGPLRTSNTDFFARHLSQNIRLTQDRYAITTTGYVMLQSSYTLADLVASHRISSKIEGLLQVQNVTDMYRNDYLSLYAVMGRQTKLGFRVRTQ